MADIYKIKLPSGTEYNIKDSSARSSLSDHETRIETLEESIEGGIHYRGITTTALTDGATTNPITIDGSSFTAQSGDIVIYHTIDKGDKEFIWDGSKWNEFGASSALKALAFKDSASASYEPTGTVTKPTFTGTSATVTVKGTPTGTVAISTGSGTANYTPDGSISAPSVTVNTTDVYSITSIGTLPSCSLPEFSATVNNEILTFSWDSGSFNAGTLPSKGSKQTVATTIKNVTAPTFTGSSVELVASFDGNELSSTGSFKPSGSVSQPTFKGTETTIIVS